GCGSGILTLVSLKLEAGSVTGTDIDPLCITSTLDNMKVNCLPEKKCSIYQGNLIDDVRLQEEIGGDYDIVVANILADIIIPLTPVIPDKMKQGGIYITSGIIDFKEEAVKEAVLEAGLTILEINHQGEWVSITAQKL
ncbi:MAG: 50S ribosomal protein L11 methyltransferase, partial [Lachnospiraceae bacterium]|nr:50S ribosomal protein L11 methyltransferase [Lachnospiraceae bacterium]